MDFIANSILCLLNVIPLLGRPALAILIPLSVSFCHIVDYRYTHRQVLYSYYALAFLMAGIILLVAMIGAIVLTMQIRTTVRRQHIFQQVSRDADHAVYLIN